jgi:putative membrane protein
VIIAWVAMIVAVVAGPTEALGVLVIGGIFGVVPRLIAAGVQVERLWGFCLTDGPTALVIERGLLNLTTQRIHADRVQSIRIDQPLLWRPLDRFRLVVDVAGHRGADGNQAALAGDLLPIAPQPIVRGLLERLEVRADLESLDYVAAPRQARWRSLRSTSFQVARTPTHLVVRSGVLWRRITIVPHARVQSVRITQGPWQRSLGLASLHLDTAGPRVRVVAHHRGHAEAIAQARECVLIAAGGVLPGQ